MQLKVKDVALNLGAKEVLEEKEDSPSYPGTTRFEHACGIFERPTAVLGLTLVLE